MKVVFVICAFFTLYLQTNGFKVLGILPFEGKSHFAIGNSILKTLHKAGHEITVISPFPQKVPIKNYRDIDISDTKQIRDDFDVFAMAKMPLTFMLIMMTTFIGELAPVTMQHPEVENLMKSDEKFDVCVLEIFHTEALLGIADHFDCVVIPFVTFGAVKWINEMTGNEMPGSYVPSPFLHFTEEMSFLQRLHNTYINRLEDILYHFVQIPNQRRVYRKYFPNAKKSFDEMMKNSAIIFVNNHVSSSSARPYLPNMIEIGGIHVEPAKPLPKDLQTFLDSATDGAIVFSMGSNIQSMEFPVKTREALVNTFGKLKQKVLWKYENETLPNKPDNVMISSWLPQRDAVAHPNVKVFITHGGLLGTTEALVEGVPVLGFPVFGDQKMNMAKAGARGYGLTVGLDEITEEKVLATLNELLSNPKYKENAEIISSRFVDRPMTPKEAVVYWTEYAVRHNGAPHLRAAGNDLNFIQFHLIDVYLTLGLIGFFIFYIVYIVFKIILKRIFKKKNPPTKLKKK